MFLLGLDRVRAALVLALGLAGLPAGVQAADFGVNGTVGPKYTTLSAHADGEPVDLGADWVHNFDHGGSRVDAWAGPSFSLGSLELSVRGAGFYIDPRNAGSAVGAGIGAAARVPVALGWSLYADGLYSPDPLNGGSIGDYMQVGGVRWSALGMISLNAGYRYDRIDGHRGRSDTSILNGPYIGTGLQF